MNSLICLPCGLLCSLCWFLTPAPFVLNNCTAMGTRVTIKANKCIELNKKCTSLFSDPVFS